MLKVQEYLKLNGLEKLKEEYAIKVTEHPNLPLIILNYSQTDSPKTNAIVRECRGLVLDKDDNFSLIGRSFFRFYNWGEVQEEMKLFDWSNFFSQEKIDGSLIVVFSYQNKWFANTRGSFGLDKIHKTNIIWKDLIWGKLDFSVLNPKLTYIFELVSPFNKVVRTYNKIELYLLTIFNKENELAVEEVDNIAGNLCRPEVYKFSSIEEIQDWLLEKSTSDPSFEGVVIRDKNNHRWKIKNIVFLKLHQLYGNGNVFNAKNLLTFILTGNKDEVLNYFPEVKEYYEKYEEKINEEYEKLKEIWIICKDIKDQKEFALTIVGKTKFSHILFQLRKNGQITDEKELKRLWQMSEEAILKNVEF